MWNLIFILFIGFGTISCLSQDVNCSRTVLFGEAEICLPIIEGYKECYTNSVAKNLADDTETDNNTVLGFYLDNKTHQKIDSLGLINFDNYFKIYATKQIKDLKADKSILIKMEEVLSENFVTKNWDDIKKEINNIDFDIEIGKPTIIKKYNLNENSFTYVMLIKYVLENSEYFTKAMTINGLILNERLIWMAYYLDNNGKESVIELQEKSNVIITDLIKTNTK